MYKLFTPFRVICIAMLMPYTVSATEVVVTLPPLAGIVSMLDEQLQVKCLLPTGADPHHFQLAPRKIESLRNSRLLIRAPFDDGGWSLPPVHAQTLKLWPHTDHGWLSPKTVRAALPGIAGELSRLQPEKRQSIAAALRQAVQQTDEIEAAWRVALAPLKGSGVLMQHPAWRRLMQDMDVPVLSVLESAQHGHEFGPHKLERALATLNRHPDAWLLADIAHSNRALAWLAGHVDKPAHRINLNALGTCGMPWTELMRRNIALFVNRQGALQRQP